MKILWLKIGKNWCLEIDQNLKWKKNKHFMVIFRWGSYPYMSLFPSIHLSHTISQEQLYSIWSWFWVHTCKVMIPPGVCFIFSKFWFFLSCCGGKRVKNSPEWKIITSVTCHLSHAIFQEQYSIWSWFFVHLCKMMIFPCIFLKFWFFGLLGGGREGGKRAKNGPKWKIITSLTHHVSGTV